MAPGHVEMANDEILTPANSFVLLKMHYGVTRILHGFSEEDRGAGPEAKDSLANNACDFVPRLLHTRAQTHERRARRSAHADGARGESRFISLTARAAVSLSTFLRAGKTTRRRESRLLERPSHSPLYTSAGAQRERSIFRTH